MTTNIVSKPEVGIYAALEDAVLMNNGLYQVPSQRKVIIQRGGHNSTGIDGGPVSGGFYFEPTRALIEAGFTIYSINAGGGQSWWNQNSVNMVVAAIARIKALYGVSKVALWGGSMGGGVMAQALKTVYADVCGLGGLSPALDLDFYHGAPYVPAYAIGGAATGAYRAEVEAAYGTNAAGYDAAAAGHKIRDEYATWRNKCPIRWWQGDTDTTVPWGMVNAFVAGVNQPQVTIRTLVGSGHVPPLPAFGGPPMKEYIDFYNSLTWA